jgi:hypothetical protein
LKQHSADGDSAAKIGEDGFGIVHGASADIEGLKAQITALSKKLDPSGKGVEIETVTTNVADSDASGEDIAMGLNLYD